MPQSPVHSQPGPDPAGEVVLGVDTHKDFHVAVVLSLLGQVLGTRSFRTTAAGYRALLAWAQSLGVVRRAGVEGTGSYGKALTRQLLAAGVAVVEVNQPDRAERRRRGKTDAIDAEAAARAVLSGRATATAKTGNGQVEMLRMFKLARESAVKARTQTLNQLKTMIITADPELRDQLTGLTTPKLVRHCAGLPDQPVTDITAAARYTLRLLARRVQQLTAEITDLARQLKATVTALAPALLQQQGIGPDHAAQLLITAGDNPDRLRSEAAFAALCGVSPIQASSGNTTRHRLNRGGDRHANSALYLIVVCRLRHCPATRAYTARRTADGKSKRDIIRCLKRYIARDIHKIITGALRPAEPAPATP
ncbi:IS110 family RNA-guided transposase [Microlunatus parietis]|uniref:Transposase n=1 Tax=Microlunatus parietis TaxID=682979 RepID=A0A7Y9I3D2_9ACTN|nr:IS110 family transposase [Microlunatus parietis]NYE69123.1 transposase [Microlunatus parietis]NYE69515.1 transposase [Microlunatus parietis]NYE70834.1 transposase [Microlunatus parietis]